MTEIATAVLMLLGAFFMLLSGVGVIRMPDVYMRLQVASKASSLGAGCLMAAVAVHYAELGIVARALLVVTFIFLTTPVSAHLIGRAAYLTGVPLWERSGRDELRGGYDPERGTLAASDADARDADADVRDADAHPDVAEDREPPPEPIAGPR
ncbi:hypothetical protein BH20CHL7_BH20CHL7_04160 [soil metagenome]